MTGSKASLVADRCMVKTSLAIFCMPEEGHFRQLCPLVAGLVRSGFAVHLFTDRRFATDVERLGATAIDLFAAHPLDRADSVSVPFPCRYVSFAGFHAEAVIEMLREIRPALVLYETFAVIGHVAARALGIPFVNISTGHNLDPAYFLPMLAADPRGAISENCHRAVEILRDRYGLSDASPFSYVSGLSPWLNICSEPPEFLTEGERNVFAPVAFYGCLADTAAATPPREAARASGNDPLRIYACFGTISLKYYPDAGIALLLALSECLADLPQARATISLGGAALDAATLRRIERPNVEVLSRVDQWAVLGESDLFVTHHGLNSTHEATFLGVPMLSYPFLMDQPLLAERCRQLGIAIPLAPAIRAPVAAAEMRTAILAAVEDLALLDETLRRARSWELEVMANRPSVLRMIEDLL
jgi:UDP:flavonoid glycosyltransferase YjiC (YdhE family)